MATKYDPTTVDYENLEEVVINVRGKGISFLQPHTGLIINGITLTIPGSGKRYEKLFDEDPEYVIQKTIQEEIDWYLFNMRPYGDLSSYEHIWEKADRTRYKLSSEVEACIVGNRSQFCVHNDFVEIEVTFKEK